MASRSSGAGTDARNGAVLRYATRVRRLIILGVLVSGTACRANHEPPAPPRSLSAEERATVERLVTEAQARAALIDQARWTAVVGPPASMLSPSSDACPVDGAAYVPDKPGDDATTAARRTYTAKRSTLASRVDVSTPGGTLEGRAATVVALDEVVWPFRSALDEDLSGSDTGAALIERLRLAIAKFEQGFDGMLVMTERVEPVLDANRTTFTVGLVSGRFYLFARAERRIVCVANIRVLGPVDFMAVGDDARGLAVNAAEVLPRQLTADAIIAGFTTMRAAR